MEDKRGFGVKKTDLIVIKWMLKTGKSQLYKVGLILVANVIWASLSVVFANFSKHIIDGAVVYHDKQYVVKYAIALFCIIMVQMSCNLFSNSFAERCRGRLDMAFKRHLLKQIIKKDYSAVTEYHTGELQNRMFNDVQIVTDGMTNIVPNVAFYIVKLLCAFLYLVIINKVFALVFLIGGLIVFTVMRLFRGKLKKLHKNVQSTEGKTRSFIQESIINLLVVKAFGVEDKIEAETEELQETNYKARMKRRLMAIFSKAGVSTTFNAGYVFALAFGALKLLEGSMTYGTVTAMLQLVNQVQGPFANLSSVLPQYYNMVASAERLMEICKLPDEEELNEADVDVEKTYAALSAINFNDISFRYDRDVILDNTSLSIKKGDFVAIMGISGIGKSTLLKLLLGVFKVQSGNVELRLGAEKLSIDRHTRKLFAYVPQGNMLLSGTIRENLTFINDNVTDEEIEEAVRIACADQFISELPLGIETVIGEKGMGLSEGQIQRLAIARSILSKSPIMLLDEATSALDEETEKQFLMNLRQMENVTCIIVSHKKAALEICNKYVRIENSKIISEDK